MSTIYAMKVLLGPALAGIGAARHVIWLVSYHVSGESRPAH
jgi:hypothetical protein